MKSREISRSKIGPFSLACTDPYIDIGWEYQSIVNIFSGPHFRLPRFDSPLTTPSEVKINGRRILPVINYYIKTLYSLNVYTQVYTLLSKILFICRNKNFLWSFT